MKINSSESNSKKKIALILLVALLLAAGGYTAFAKSSSMWPFENGTSESTQTSSEDTYVESDTGANTDKSVPKSTDNPKSPADNSKPDTNTNSSSSDTGQIPVTITYIQSIGDKIKLGTNIEAITNTGNCTLSVKDSSGTEVYTEVSGIQALPSSSTCKGFSIPASSIRSGTHTYVVTVTQADKSGTTSKEYTKN